MVEQTTGTQANGAKPKKNARAKIDEVRERARSTVQGIDANPVGVLVGGLAFGLVAGALVPRSEREKQALRPVGKRLAEGAIAAVGAAKETGREQLGAAMLGRDAAKDSMRKVFDSAIGAAKESGQKTTTEAA